MDFELRGDAEILPTFDGVLSHFKQDLQAQEEYEERRTAYVALTRARRRLFCTGAHWYGENMNAKEGGKFLESSRSGCRDGRHGTCDPGDGHRRGDEPAPRLPRAVREGLARTGAARRSDEVFPDGWRRAAVDAVAIGGVQPTAAGSA